MEFLSRCNNQEKYDGLRRPTATGPYFQGALHFADNADEETEYAYDANGNTIADLNRSVLSTTYDFNGMPRTMTFADGSANAYVYDATGRKRRTVHRVASAPPSVPGAEPSGFVTMTADYCGDMLYEDSTLTRIDFEGGYLSFSDTYGNALAAPEYHFYVRDHLGNNRMDLTESGAITQIVDYYPFGLPMGCSYRPAAQRRLFGGKELDRTSGLNLYDQEARLYDPATGRFTRPDPLSERTPGISEFLFCAANPVNYIDPSGMVFTEGSKSYVKSLKKGIKDRQDKNKRKIEDLKSELSARELSEKTQKKIQREIDKFQDKNADLQKVANEISILENSDQIYDMVLDTSKNIEGNAALGVTTIVSKTSYDVSSGIVRMTIGDSSLNMISHELKHAYQFETGELDFRATKGQTGEMYDITDEKAAYDRGRMFGPNQSSEKDNTYKDLPKDYKSVRDFNVLDSKSLQRASNLSKLIFRWSGITYKPYIK